MKVVLSQINFIGVLRRMSVTYTATLSVREETVLFVSSPGCTPNACAAGPASAPDTKDNILPNGLPAGGPEEALDCACGLYLGDPTAWLQPPTN
jgi:hypothetical protein